MQTILHCFPEQIVPLLTQGSVEQGRSLQVVNGVRTVDHAWQGPLAQAWSQREDQAKQ